MLSSRTRHLRFTVPYIRKRARGNEAVALLGINPGRDLSTGPQTKLPCPAFEVADHFRMVSQVEGGLMVYGLGTLQQSPFCKFEEGGGARPPTARKDFCHLPNWQHNLLSVNFVGRVAPEVYLHPAVESEASNLDMFVKAIGTGGDDPASQLCYTGIMALTKLKPTQKNRNPSGTSWRREAVWLPATHEDFQQGPWCHMEGPDSQWSHWDLTTLGLQKLSNLGRPLLGYGPSGWGPLRCDAWLIEITTSCCPAPKPHLGVPQTWWRICAGTLWRMGFRLQRLPLWLATLWMARWHSYSCPSCWGSHHLETRQLNSQGEEAHTTSYVGCNLGF